MHKYLVTKTKKLQNIGVNENVLENMVLEILEEISNIIPWRRVEIDSHKNEYLIGALGVEVLGFKIGEKQLITREWVTDNVYKMIRYSKELYFLNDGTIRVFNSKNIYMSTDGDDFEDEEVISSYWKRVLSPSKNIEEFDIDVDSISNLCERVKKVASPKLTPVKNGIFTEWVAL